MFSQTQRDHGNPFVMSVNILVKNHHLRPKGGFEVFRYSRDFVMNVIVKTGFIKISSFMFSPGFIPTLRQALNRQDWQRFRVVLVI